MSNMNYATLICHNAVKEICKPLFDLLDIQYFSITLYSHDGNITRLSTAPAWSDHYIEQGYYNITPLLNKNNAMTHYSIWDHLPKDENVEFMKILHEAKEYKIAYGLTLVKHFKEYKITCSIASPNNPNYITDRYISNVTCIENFIYYFLDKAHPLIKREKKNKVLLPFPSETCNDVSLKEVADRHHDFYQSIMQKKLYFNDTLLSKQEALCVALLMYGKTSKRIAKVLNISSRTVDYYIDNVKSKLDCSDRNSLVEKAFGADSLKQKFLNLVSLHYQELLL